MAPATKTVRRIKGSVQPVDRMIRQSRVVPRVQTTDTDPREAGTVLDSVMASGGATTAGNKIRGYEGQMYYTPGSGTETLFANVTDFDLTVKADSLDSTDRSTVGWKDKIGGLKEWSGTITANAIQNGVDLTTFYAALVGGLTLSGSFRPQDVTAGIAYNGSFVITSYKHSSKQTGMQTIELSVEGRGALVLGTVTTSGS